MKAENLHLLLVAMDAVARNYVHCLRFHNTMSTIATTIVLYLGFLEITIAFSGA